MNENKKTSLEDMNNFEESIEHTLSNSLQYRTESRQCRRRCESGSGTNRSRGTCVKDQNLSSETKTLALHEGNNTSSGIDCRDSYEDSLPNDDNKGRESIYEEKRIGGIARNEVDLFLSLGLINHPASVQLGIRPARKKKNECNESNKQPIPRTVTFIDPLVTKMRQIPRIEEKDLPLLFYTEKDLER